MDDPWPTVGTPEADRYYKSKRELQEFFDAAIRSWRAQRDNAVTETQRSHAVIRIDTIQALRMTMLGSTLGEPKLNEKERDALRSVVVCHDNALENGEGMYTNSVDINVLRELLLED